MSAAAPAALRRELGLPGATLMGLGSMVGTGVFVSIGVAAGAAGTAVVLAIVIAAAVATCNALSSAQLAASHAVSGGTYEYGYRYLSPALGFTAGWMFLCAKSASAATAALGFAGYLLALLGADAGARTGIALAAVAVLTALVAGGMRRSHRANVAIVSVTVLALGAFAAVGMPGALRDGAQALRPWLPGSDAGAPSAFLYATALMFVAFTGYGRIATLGEEVREPRRTIPRAIVATVVIATLLYVLVAMAALGAVGAERLGGVTRAHATPLAIAARALGPPWLAVLVAVGAVTAMLGVLLNLILGLSRVVLAMGRQGDLPPRFARLRADGAGPVAAVAGVGVAIALLVLTGSVETTWAFSAFTVLVYYAITHLAALRLPAEARLYPRGLALAGLLACVFLAVWVPARIWLGGLALIALGLGWHLWVAPRWRAAGAR